jgi:methylated-DNA-[protein]-cysteine S-methyltransferase
MTILDTARVPTPLGTVVVLARGDALVGLEFDDCDGRVAALHERVRRHLGAFETRVARDPAGAVTRLRAYFGGDLGALEAQRVELLGSDFERAAWSALRRIPVGRTISYSELAARVGRPHAARAVGRANGRNPVSLFVPCHRVIAADGTLAGYGGGLDRKRRLLEHEGALEPALL